VDKEELLNVFCEFLFLFFYENVIFTKYKSNRKSLGKSPIKISEKTNRDTKN